MPCTCVLWLFQPVKLRDKVALKRVSQVHQRALPAPNQRPTNRHEPVAVCSVQVYALSVGIDRWSVCLCAVRSLLFCHSLRYVLPLYCTLTYKQPGWKLKYFKAVMSSKPKLWRRACRLQRASADDSEPVTRCVSAGWTQCFCCLNDKEIGFSPVLSSGLLLHWFSSGEKMANCFCTRVAWQAPPLLNGGYT